MQINLFAIFSSLSLIFLNISQDCSLGKCLTSNSAETSKKFIFFSSIFFLTLLKEERSY